MQSGFHPQDFHMWKSCGYFNKTRKRLVAPTHHTLPEAFRGGSLLKGRTPERRSELLTATSLSNEHRECLGCRFSGN
jgi:hypothetical protein